MLKIFMKRLSLPFKAPPKRLFSGTNPLTALLVKHPQNNHQKIKEFLEKLKPDEHVNVKKKHIRAYLDQYGQSIDVQVKKRFIRLLLMDVHSVEEFVHNIPYYQTFDDYLMDKWFCGELKIRFFKFIAEMDKDSVLDFLRTFPAIASNMNNMEMQRIVVGHFQGYDYKQLFLTFLEINFITNNFLYNILANITAEDLFEGLDKNELYSSLAGNGIIFSKELKIYFADQLDAPRPAIKSVFEPSMLSVFTYKEIKEVFLKASLEELLATKLAFSGEERTKKILNDYQVNSLIERRLYSEVHNKQKALDYYPVMVQIDCPKGLDSLDKALSPFFSELKELFFMDADHLDVFLSEVHIFHQFVSGLAKLGDLSAKEKNVKNSVSNLLGKFTDFVEKMVLEEDISQNMASLEDIAFRKGKLDKIALKLKAYTFPASIIDMMIEAYEMIVGLNVAKANVYNVFGVFFSDGFKKLTVDQFARVLFCMCETNYELDQYLFQIEEYLKSVSEQKPSFIADSSPDLAIALAYYLALKSDFESPLWKAVDQKLQRISLEISSLPNRQQEVVALVKSILSAKRSGLLQKVPLRLDPSVRFLPPGALSAYLSEFFSHLFMKSLEGNAEVGCVNAHYVQGRYALICADYELLTSNLHVLKGRSQLAKMVLDENFEEVGVVMQTRMDLFDKKNEEMHNLRQALRKWKVDYDAKEKHYDKAFENVHIDEYLEAERR